MDQYIEDDQFLCDCRIDTAEELSAFREDIDTRIKQLEKQREQIRNRIRRAPEAEKAHLKEQAKALTSQITPLRKQLKIADRILERSVRMRQLLDQERQLETMESEDCTPSLSQAIALKQSSQTGNLTMDRSFTIMTQPKANQREKISFRTDEVRKFFPKNYTPAQMQAVILKLLDEYQRKRQRDLAR